jgi:hypothetical protein
VSFANRLYSAVLDGRMDLDAALDRMAERADWERGVAEADDLIRASDRSRPTDAVQPSSRKLAPAVFAFHQPGFGGMPGFDCYTLTEDVGGHPKNSTVSEHTLRKLGYHVPAKEEAA